MAPPVHETSPRSARADDARREARLFVDALRALRRAARLVRGRSDEDVARALTEATTTTTTNVRALPLRAREDVVVADVARAVRWLGRFFGARRCLVEALAARELLALRGISSTVRFGVTRAGATHDGATLTAHAWLEHDGAVVVGGGPHTHAPLAPVARVTVAPVTVAPVTVAPVTLAPEGEAHARDAEGA